MTAPKKSRVSGIAPGVGKFEHTLRTRQAEAHARYVRANGGAARVTPVKEPKSPR